MEYIVKIVKSLEKSIRLIKGNRKRIKNEAKKTKNTRNSLVIVLPKRGVIRAVEKTVRS